MSDQPLSESAYRGRFAPSPTGPLHAGSLVAALASWLDARAHNGTWLVRIEDVDTPRCVPGADHTILQQLAACGLVSDEPVLWQSQRSGMYQAALDRLITNGLGACAAEGVESENRPQRGQFSPDLQPHSPAMGQEDGEKWTAAGDLQPTILLPRRLLAYPCACSRKDIAAALTAQGVARERHHAAVYPGTCRPERGGLRGRPARAWRFHLPAEATVHWSDAQLGAQAQDVATAVGDFVLKRADGLWAYQLAVVVDDAAQGISHVVRGEDLADNTARQILLQQALNLPTPHYRHTPLVLGANGEKLSKQNGAEALDLSDPLAALNQAAIALGLPVAGGGLVEWLAQSVRHWRVAIGR